MKKHALVKAVKKAALAQSRFNDAVQKTVEYLFARNKDVPEIAKSLALAPEEALKRYTQVLRDYITQADALNEDWAKVEILRLMRLSHERREEARLAIEEVKRLATLQGKYVFPAEEYKAMREEDKMIYKMTRDFLNDGAKRQKREEKRQAPASPYDHAVPNAAREEVTAHFVSIAQKYNERPTDEVLTDSLLADLRQAVGAEEAGVYGAVGTDYPLLEVDEDED